MMLRRNSLAIVTAVTFLGLGLPAAAEEPWYSVYRSDHREWTLALTGGFALLDLDGEGTVDEGMGDTDISLDGTLDLSELETFFGEVDLQLFRGQHLRFAYTPMRFDGSESLDTAIVVDGVTYDVGDQVESDLKLDQYELSFRSEFWIGEYLTVAPLLQVTLVDARVSIDNNTLGISEREKALLPLPYLGLRGELYPHARIQLFAEGKGFTIGKTGTVWEANGGVAVHLTRNLSLMGRYRYSDYAVEFQDSEIDLSIGGPQLAATIRF